jgi:hypothetical protein
MTLAAQVAGVAILVRSAVGERNDVIRHGGFRDDALGSTIAAERFGLKAA